MSEIMAAKYEQNRIMKKEDIEEIIDKKFVKLYDFKHAPGKHYYCATRRNIDELMAVKSNEEFKCALPDAVTCMVILCLPDKEPMLLLTLEHRYTVGRFLLSPPAGLIDDEDKAKEDAIILTAKREIEEETGIKVSDNDSVFTINPLLFSSPGMTDESNALVGAVVKVKDLSSLTTKGAVGGELFAGFKLYTVDEVQRILDSGVDEDGFYYSIYAYVVMEYFVSGKWKQAR